MIKRTIVSFFVFFLLSVPLVFAQLPEAVTTKKEMVVTANPLATAAGEKILRKGGTAADAMVAVQTVLGLVEPQSSGLGGGAFVVYYDARTGETTTIDAREKAPAAATEDRFAAYAGSFAGFVTAWQSGLSVGVPGTPRMMEYVHDKYGRLPWRKLFRPAIKLAQNGYPLTGRTSDQVQSSLDRNTDPFSCENRLFFRDPTAFDYFANPDCTAKAEGTVMFNQPYADTLKAMRRHGADAFYTGTIAESIAAAVQGDLAIAGDMTVEDLENYNVKERPPVCLNYRGHNVCGMGPPSSGALAVGQILGILENFTLEGDPLAVENVHLVMQAGRLAFADRGLYVGDPDFVNVPVEGMLNEDYLKTRADLITDMDMGTADPGVPPGVVVSAAADATAKNSGTSHVSIVDRWGNALSMTTTIESSFGNGVMVHGFLLNNELTDFSFSPTSGDLLVANRVQPNKRPRSSMSPTIVFDEDGRVEIVTGSPGGSRIIGYTAQSIINMIDFGLDPQQAINVPHYLNRNGSSDIEEPIPDVTLDYDASALANALVSLGYSVNTRGLTSGLSIIQILRKHRPYGHHDNGDEEVDEIVEEVEEADEIVEEVDEADEIVEEVDEADELTEEVLAEKGAKDGYKHRWHHGRYWWNHHRTTLVGGADKRRDGTVGGR